MNERGQISIATCGLVLTLVLGGVLLARLGTVDRAGGTAQRAADQAPLAAARTIAADPASTREQLSAAAGRSADANEAHLVSLRPVTRGGVTVGVVVSVGVSTARGDRVTARAAADVTFSAQPSERSFRPVDLSGLTGRAAVVAAAEAQVGWPYVWGGESRAEGGFDCSGLVDFAFQAAGAPLPGRPTAAGLWQMARHVTPDRLQPGDLVFGGAAAGAPYHVGIYVGGGVVLAAPHTGAVVGYAPLDAGGWDGFGSLLGDGGGIQTDDPVAAAARERQVPSHVLQAELAIGLAADAESAATALAAAQANHPGSLLDALTEQIGDRSLAALVLARASGPGLDTTSQIRLRSLEAIDAASDPPPLAAQPAGAVPVASGGGSRSRVTLLDRLGTGLGVGETLLTQLGERGRAMPLQAVAGIRNLSRFGLSGLGALLPDPSWRDASNLAGSIWDAGAGARELMAATGTGGVELSGFGLWAARFSLLGGALSTGMFAWQAATAHRTRDRVAYGLLAAGSAATTAGLLSGGSLLALGAATSVVPPVGLALIATGAVLCAAGYLVQHPAWCRSALSAGGRALDLAWRVQTAPVRVAAAAAGTVVDAAKSVVDAIPTPW